MQNYSNYTIFQAKMEWISCELFQFSMGKNQKLFTITFNVLYKQFQVINNLVKIINIVIHFKLWITIKQD